MKDVLILNKRSHCILSNTSDTRQQAKLCYLKFKVMKLFEQNWFVLL